jgi:hypothetical protein
MRFTACAGALLVLTRIALADFPTTNPYAEIRYVHDQVQGKLPQQIHVAWIDLSDRDVDVRVAPGGEDPDGPGEWQTTLMTPSAIAQREDFDIAINGDFFAAKKTEDAEGPDSGYVTGKWARAIGPAVSNGTTWAVAERPRPILMLDAKKKPSIGPVQDPPSDARQVIAGSDLLVRARGNVVKSQTRFALTRHPRTAVGIADAGKRLVFVVVDGRQPGVASGMTLRELADYMVEQGCQAAINLDGGGSTELLIRNPETGELTLMSTPSDGRERAVANVLGVTILGSKRTPTSQPARVQSR